MIRINIDPMTPIRALAEASVDAFFNGVAAANVQKDQEYALKRAIAKRVIEEPGYEAPAAFSGEAALMNLTAAELAQSIAGRPDTVLERGFARRTAILSVRAAQDPDAIDAVLQRYGIPMLITLPQGG